jgi:hypothetical protein
MNPISLLVELQQLGVELFVEGDRIRYRARRGTMTPELRAAIVEQKAELLAVLSVPLEKPPKPCVVAPTKHPPAFAAEEMLYRLWWKTLPDKAMARQMNGHLKYWGVQRNLSEEMMAGLKERVRDLLEERREQER